MSQQSLDIPGSPLGGGALVASLENILKALASSRMGNSRPPDVQPGEIWIDNNTDPAWSVKLWDGDADIVLFTVDTGTDKAVVPVGSGGTGKTTPAEALVALGGEPLISKLSGFNLALATEGQAQEAAINTALMTPLRTWQQLLAKVATQAEAEGATVDNKFMTPLKTALFLAGRIGTDAGSLVACASEGKLPPLDGSALTGVGVWDDIGTVSTDTALASLDIEDLVPGGIYRLIIDCALQYGDTYPAALRCQFKTTTWLTGTYTSAYDTHSNGGSTYGPYLYNTTGYGEVSDVVGGPYLFGEALLKCGEAGVSPAVLMSLGSCGLNGSFGHTYYSQLVDITGIKLYPSQYGILGKVHVQKLKEA